MRFHPRIGHRDTPRGWFGAAYGITFIVLGALSMYTDSLAWRHVGKPGNGPPTLVLAIVDIIVAVVFLSLGITAIVRAGRTR